MAVALAEYLQPDLDKNGSFPQGLAMAVLRPLDVEEPISAEGWDLVAIFCSRLLRFPTNRNRLPTLILA